MVIDLHTHIFPDKIAEATISALSKNANIMAHANGTKNGLIESMRVSGVDISINLPAMTKASQLGSINTFAKCLNEENHTLPRIISFAGFHPDIENYKEELYKIKENGFLGIKLHPDYQGTFFDDERYISILKCAKELDLITVTHAGLDGAFVGQEIKCTPSRVLRVLDKIGGYSKLVLAHLGGNELFDEVYKGLAGCDVYFDTSYVLINTKKEDFLKMIEKHTADKILFATDSPWQSQGQMIDKLKSYELPKEIEDKILYKNATKLLNI